jgi:hypothetical protein
VNRDADLQRSSHGSRETGNGQEMGKVLSQRVEWADNAQRPLIEDVGVDLRGGYVAMAQFVEPAC